MIPTEGEKNQYGFEKYYLKLCAQQNCAPVSNVKKQLPKRVLDFIGDNIKLHEWYILLKALRTGTSLKAIAIRSRSTRQKGNILVCV